MSATVWCGCVQVASLGERCPQAERCTKLAEKLEALAAASADILTVERGLGGRGRALTDASAVAIVACIGA